METWLSPDGSEIDTAAILTTAANREFSAIHHRMPLVVQPEHFTRWLDCSGGDARTVEDLMAPVGEGLLEAVPVSDRVNKVANVGPDIQEPGPLAEADVDEAGDGAAPLGGGQQPTLL